MSGPQKVTHRAIKSKRDVPASARPQPANSAQVKGNGTPPSQNGYIAIQKNETDLISPQTTPPTLWLNPFDQFSNFLQQQETTQVALTDFLERRMEWFNAAETSGKFSPQARAGINQFKQLVFASIETYAQVKSNLSSPITRSEWWQEPETFDALEVQFQFFVEYAPIIDLLITASDNQSILTAPHQDLNASTPLTQVALEDFFTGFAAITSGNPAGSIMGQELIEKTKVHVDLLMQYEQITLQYQAHLNVLKDLTSPLVGVDAPWQGHYEPEYPDETGYNSSKLPAEILNALPLQQAYQRADKDVWDATFKIINRNPASAEHKVGELMADAMWHREEKIFSKWNGQPWERLEKAATQRAAAIAPMQEMIKAAQAYVPAGGSLEAAIREMKPAIKAARKLLRELQTIWRGGGLIPEVPEHLHRLKPIFMQLANAEDALNLAESTLNAGDSETAKRHYLQAQRHYVLAVETPRFKSLLTLAEKYQTLSFYTKLGVTVATTVVGAGLGAMAFAGAEGALLSAGASVNVIRIGSLAVNGATFAVSTNLLNNALLNEQLPKGAGGWTYEVTSNTLLFGALGKIALKWGKPLGNLAEGGLARALGSKAATQWGGKVIYVGGEVTQMVPNYLFFASTWTPVDMMAQQFVNDATFTPKEVIDRAYSWQSFAIQAGFLGALRLGNAAVFPLINPLYQKLANYANRAITQRLESLDERRTALQNKLDVLPRQEGGNPAEVMAQGALLTRKLATVVREEFDLLSLFDTDAPHIINRRAELAGLNETYTAATQQFRSMSDLTATFQRAQVHHLAAGLVSYDPAAQNIVRGLCAQNSALFSLRDVGSGNFIFAWKGHFGEAFEVTMVPTPKGPLSESTAIVPAKAD